MYAGVPTTSPSMVIKGESGDSPCSRRSDVNSVVFSGLIRTPPDNRNPDAIAAGRDDFSAQVAIMDRYLGESEYLAGPDITMGDISPASFVFRWFNLPIEREDYPNLKRWYDSLAARPAYKKVVIDIGLQ